MSIARGVHKLSLARNPVDVQGDRISALHVVDLRSEAICAWQGTLPEGHRFEATQALRQVLNRAVAWELIDVNPAKRGVDNPLRRFPEKRPFESWAEIETVAGKLGRVLGPMVVFAAATGLRPSELFALETSRPRPHRRHRLRPARVREGAPNQHKGDPQHASGALAGYGARGAEQLPPSDSPLLFPAARGGHIELHSFRQRYWRPRKPWLGSNRSVARTTCATPTPPSHSVPASRSSTSPGSWAQAWR